MGERIIGEQQMTEGKEKLAEGKTVLVIGASGMVGSRFIELCGGENFFCPDRSELDITDEDQVKRFIKEHNPDYIINFAAFTDVNEAEKQKGDKEGECYQANIIGVKNILDAIDPNKTHFIQISTDMVFSGLSGPYERSEPAERDINKLTWYGFTKAEAERLILERLGEQATIVRIIYPVRAKFDQKPDYLRKPLKLFDEGRLYPMFGDQVVSVTFIDEVCLVLKNIIENDINGVFHASSCDTTTPYELISYLVERAREAKGVVKKSSIDDFLRKTDTPVRYPKRGGLKVEETERELGISFSSWREVVDLLVNQGL